MIVKNAFCPTACITGSVAGTIIFSMVEGLKRGAFSNEAGLGSTVAVHSSCRIKSPELQGTWAMAEVFIDTFVICTLTAVVIIISGTDLTGGGHGSEGLQCCSWWSGEVFHVRFADTFCISDSGRVVFHRGEGLEIPFPSK